MKKILIVIILLICAGVIGFFGYLAINNYYGDNQRKAVFMDSGQVYFGYIKKLNDQFVELDDVYYLKTSDLEGDNPEKKIILVKMGSELHMPENTMYISRDQILFFQDLQESSKINTSIKTFIQKQTASN